MGAWLAYGLLAVISIVSFIYFSKQDSKKEKLKQIQQQRQASAKRDRDKFINGIYNATDGNKVYIENGKVTISEE